MAYSFPKTCLLCSQHLLTHTTPVLLLHRADRFKFRPVQVNSFQFVYEISDFDGHSGVQSSSGGVLKILYLPPPVLPSASNLVC